MIMQGTDDEDEYDEVQYCELLELWNVKRSLDNKSVLMLNDASTKEYSSLKKNYTPAFTQFYF